MKAMDDYNQMTNGGCLRSLIAILIMCIVAIYIVCAEPEIIDKLKHYISCLFYLS